MRFLLDTNTVIFLLKNPQDGAVSKNLRRVKAADVVTSAIVMSELLSGAHRGSPERLERNLMTLNALRFPVLPFEASDAQAAGIIDAALKREGRAIGPLDTLIAGQGLARGLTVVTNNLREFNRVDGLIAVDWSI
jgi:tRNA(fMet)-specific endonuclease VapC